MMYHIIPKFDRITTAAYISLRLSREENQLVSANFKIAKISLNMWDFDNVNNFYLNIFF
jgi:hypothetical protein